MPWGLLLNKIEVVGKSEELAVIECEKV